MDVLVEENSLHNFEICTDKTHWWALVRYTDFMSHLTSMENKGEKLKYISIDGRSLNTDFIAVRTRLPEFYHGILNKPVICIEETTPASFEDRIEDVIKRGYEIQCIDTGVLADSDTIYMAILTRIKGNK